MKKHVLVYGLVGGLLVAILKVIEYRYLVIEHSIEIYGGLIATVFATLGIWLGVSLTRPSPTVVIREVEVREVPAAAVTTAFVENLQEIQRLGITKRELEILTLIAGGLSNREIAERLFISENTVKTHSSRLFDKLQAKRRTQAVQLAKQCGLIA